MSESVGIDQQLIDEFDRHGLDAVLRLLDTLESRSAVEACVRLQREFYWKRKNLRGVVAFSAAGIERALRDLKLRAVAKTLAANLASFTWPGWDEPGIVISAEDLSAGMEAARLNVRLADELGRPDKAKANALWTLGAHQLAARDYQAAITTFQAARTFAEGAGETVGRLMLDGYLCLIDVLTAPADAGARARFDGIVAALISVGSEDSAEYARQLPVALRVFSSENKDAMISDRVVR